MWESLQGLKSLQTLEFWINLASNLPRMGVIANFFKKKPTEAICPIG